MNRFAVAAHVIFPSIDVVVHCQLAVVATACDKTIADVVVERVQFPARNEPRLIDSGIDIAQVYPEYITIPYAGDRAFRIGQEPQAVAGEAVSDVPHRSDVG